MEEESENVIIEQLRLDNQILSTALAFYADPETYFGIGFFPDSPCGAFIDDFEDDCIDVDGFDLGTKPGKLARETLNLTTVVEK